MGTTANFALPYPELANVPNVQPDLKALAEATDTALGNTKGMLLGAVMDWPWASGQLPSWTLLPYGQNVLASAYPQLQTLGDNSGRPYGGTAGTNITLPDYRGRIGAGKDDMGGTAANRITAAISGVSGATLGAVLGAEGITLVTGNLPAHNHGITGAPGISDPTHAHSVSDPTHAHVINLRQFGGGSEDYMGYGGTSTSTDYGDHWMAKGQATGIGIYGAGTGITVSAGSLGTGNTGSGSTVRCTQPTIIVNTFMRVL